MPENLSNILILSLLIGVGILATVSLVVKLLKNKCAKIQTVKAIVTNKYKTEVFSKYAGNGKKEKYVVVFSTGSRKLSFYVSELSYRGYHVKEEGTLTYKGDRLIDFQ